MVCDFTQLANPGIAAINPYEPGKPLEEVAKQFGFTEDQVVKLASNECPLGPSEKALQVLNNQLYALHRYPDGASHELKQALTQCLQVNPQQIVIGNGSNDILEMVARVFTGPGKRVIYSQYAFAIYGLVAQANGARGVEVPADNWRHDLAAMADAAKEKTAVIFVANPNNPTGTYCSKSQLVQLLDQVASDVVVVLDEAYFEYVEQSDYPNGLALLDQYPNLVVTRTFSKAYGLAGLRIGYAVCHPQIADLFNRVRQPFNVNSLAQAAAVAALQDSEHVSKAVSLNRQEMQRLGEYFDQQGLDYIPSVGNFISVDVGDGSGVFNKLLAQGVIVRPMASYHMERFIRVSIGTELENNKFMQALSTVLSS